MDNLQQVSSFASCFSPPWKAALPFPRSPLPLCPPIPTDSACTISPSRSASSHRYQMTPPLAAATLAGDPIAPTRAPSARSHAQARVTETLGGAGESHSPALLSLQFAELAACYLYCPSTAMTKASGYLDLNFSTSVFATTRSL